MIQADCLTKRYGRIVAVEELSFRVQPGEILGFLGPNGAGKSTTLRILSGYLPPTSGSAQINGLDLTQHSLLARRSIGYLPENFVAAPELRVGEYLRFRAKLKGLKASEAKARTIELAAALGLTDRLKQSFAALSKGFKQRVGLADVLIADPPALLLDEPFGGLDPLQRHELRSFLAKLAADGKAILFSSHVLPEVEELAQRVLILHQGRAQADGTIEELGRRAAEQAPVQFRTEADPAGLALALADALPAAELASLKQHGAIFELLPESAERRHGLFQWLAQRKEPIAEFRTLAPSLDDLFRSMTESQPPSQTQPQQPS
ncbi:MAG: ABC transporter ATP-binding protein [Planctomycetes bacterium]|nr:ABC transporter ATP-binding protein [Planctomycetota bacterium]